MIGCAPPLRNNYVYLSPTEHSVHLTARVVEIDFGLSLYAHCVLYNIILCYARCLLSHLFWGHERIIIIIIIIRNRSQSVIHNFTLCSCLGPFQLGKWVAVDAWILCIYVCEAIVIELVRVQEAKGSKKPEINQRDLCVIYNYASDCRTMAVVNI